MTSNSELADGRPFPRLSRRVREVPGLSRLSQVVIGIAAALIAVGIRYLLPLSPHQLPTLPLVVSLAIVTLFVGALCGITTAVVGGFLSWYIFFNPSSWSLAHGAWVPLLGFVVIAAVIITTSHLYRRSERLLHERQIAELEDQAATADLFAREIAHRLKNSLAVVQAISFQTLGSETPETQKFAGRLKALADANDLLSEHVSDPTANVVKVIDAALSPFAGERSRILIDSVEADIAAQQVVSLALALHELATNSIKYGALSRPEGVATLRVEDRGNRISVSWEERDGPPVTPPETLGFGTRLLKRAGLNTKLDFRPEGLRCSFDIRKN